MATEATTVLTSFLPDSPLRTAILLLVVTAIVLTVIKPDVMYDEKDHFKAFGTGPDQTLLPFWLAITMIGIVSYYLSFAMASP